MRAPDKNAFTIREALQGNVSLDALPFELARTIRAIQRCMRRQADRFAKRERKANHNRFCAVSLGGGKRERTRRLRQIERGQLTAANGLAA
jgi:hypothetical protein